ncbi:hypothetical protein BV25DRAFT_1816767, partial [Artomyces pyxidatus]
KAIVDRASRIVVYLAGRPRGDKTWDACAAEASQALSAASVACKEDFRLDQTAHQRGKYPILHAGYSHGGGPKTPYNVDKKTELQGKVVEALKSNKALSRIAGFASSAFQMAAPRIFARYETCLADIKAASPRLSKPYANSIFPTATFNLGPQAITLPHRDAQNVPYGWCAIMALGTYDSEKGGHLYLWELNMVIEFPPGSTILVPSVLITHGHTLIQPGETRQSFTLYCAGALMRWHTYGLRTERTLSVQDLGLRRRLKATARTRQLDAMALFLKLGGLASDHAAVRRY